MQKPFKAKYLSLNVIKVIEYFTNIHKISNELIIAWQLD